MGFPKKILIREIGVREGFQAFPKVVATEKKLKLINLLTKTGVKEIEVTSFVREDLVPQMADADKLVSNLPKKNNITYTALYLNRQGFQRAVKHKNLSLKGWVYLSASESFLKKNNNTSNDKVLSSLQLWQSTFKTYKVPFQGIMISTAFGCNYEGRIKERDFTKFIKKTSRALNRVGLKPKEISLADTMGWGIPTQVRKFIKITREFFPKSAVSLHLHDTRGMGIANVFVGLEEGIKIFEGSVGGIGGCPFALGASGNIATEDLVYLCNSLNIKTGIDLEKYCQAAIEAEKIIGKELPGHYYKFYKSVKLRKKKKIV